MNSLASFRRRCLPPPQFESHNVSKHTLIRKKIDPSDKVYFSYDCFYMIRIWPRYIIAYIDLPGYLK